MQIDQEIVPREVLNLLVFFITSENFVRFQTCAKLRRDFCTRGNFSNSKPVHFDILWVAPRYFHKIEIYNFQSQHQSSQANNDPNNKDQESR